MARTVDPHRHNERRGAILEEAYRQFARSGFDRTSTASICRSVGISSGTFFHYFPTKIDVLVGILVAGAEATRGQLQQIEANTSGLAAVLAYTQALEVDLSDEHFGGFVHAVGAVSRLADVAAALQTESELTAGFLRRHLELATDAQNVRSDVPVETLATWTAWILDGAAQHAVGGEVTSGALAHAVRALLGASG